MVCAKLTFGLVALARPRWCLDLIGQRGGPSLDATTFGSGFGQTQRAFMEAYLV